MEDSWEFLMVWSQSTESSFFHDRLIAFLTLGKVVLVYLYLSFEQRRAPSNEIVRLPLRRLPLREWICFYQSKCCRRTIATSLWELDAVGLWCITQRPPKDP